MARTPTHKQEQKENLCPFRMQINYQRHHLPRSLLRVCILVVFQLTHIIAGRGEKLSFPLLEAVQSGHPVSQDVKVDDDSAEL